MTDQKILAKLAVDDSLNRKNIIRKLNDKDLLKQIADSDKDEYIRYVATTRLKILEK